MKMTLRKVLAIGLCGMMAFGHLIPLVAEEPTPTEQTEEVVEELPQEEVVEEVTETVEPTVEPEEVVEENVETSSEDEKVEGTTEEKEVPQEETVETTTEEVVEEKIETVEEVVPTAFDQEVTVDGVVVHVEAEAGVFPNEATLSVEKVTLQVEQEVSNAIEEKRDENKNVALSYTFDIKVLDQDGNEVQPTDQQKVKVYFTLAEVKNENLETQVYHVTEDTLEVESLAVETDGETAVVETTGFSYYTVEFTYQNLQYVLEGDASVSLDEILSTLQLSGAVTDAQVSNAELFNVTNENGTWMVHALQAFTSEEWMKVTIDGVVYEVVVTDSPAPANITSQRNMNNGETWEGNFTITGGPVRSPDNGTATIKDGTITNNATNTAKGGFSSTKGSALISRASGGYNLENVTMNNTSNNLVLNIWANASINAKNVTLDGQNANTDNTIPFLMIGGYPNGGAGSLNFSGDNTIQNTKGSIIGGNNNSFINVNDGTLTIKNSDLRFLNGIKLYVKSGATLVFDNSTFSQNTPTIVLEDGATLIVQNDSVFTTIPNAGAFNVGNGTKVIVDHSDFNLGVNSGMEIASGGSLEIKNGTTFYMNGNGTGINSSGDITIEDSTVNGNKERTKIVAKDGSLSVKNSNLNTVWIDHYVDVDITGSNLSDCMIKSRANTTLNIDTSFLHDSNRNSEETMIHSSGDGVTVNITNSSIYDNTNTSGTEGATVVKVLNGTLNVTGSTFTNNHSKAYGGAIYVNNTELNVSDSTFIENKIDNPNNGGGGAIAIIDSPVTIERSDFVNNDANLKGKGGAIYINNNGKESLTIDDESSFANNRGQIGGAIYINGLPDATIGASTFRGNGYNGFDDPEDDYGAQDAGAIYIESGSGPTKVILNGTKFEENVAMAEGSSSGGAIYARGGNTSLIIYGAKFKNNVSGLYGGAMTVAHSASAYISDLNGDPTEFIGNMVLYATDHAGGGLFINQGYVHMDDVAIYNNYAKDGGGGISSCTKGAAEAKVLGGAAIFDNHVGEDLLDGMDPMMEGAGHKYPTPEITSYPDIFFETKDHIDRGTGEQIREWEIWPIELYERMFNGGLHKWSAKPFDGVKVHDTTLLNSFMAKSNPTNKDVSAAQVVFTENIATSLGETVWTATGGAIGCNGLLEMGRGTEIKIVKVWDDARNNDGYRPDLDEKFLDNLIVKANGEEIDIKADPIKTQVVNIKDFDPAALANNIVNMVDPQKDYSDFDAWVIVISGLDLLDDSGNQIRYTIEERDQEYYTLIENLGSNETYFEMKNRHEPDLVNIAVEKVWEDQDNQDGLRPDSITVRLLADGEEVDTAVLNERGQWKASFEGLPRYKETKEIVYTITEDAIDGYQTNIAITRDEETTVTPERDSSDSEELDNDKIEELDQPINLEQIVVEKEFVITNTHEVEKVNVSGTKTWVDNNNSEKKRPTLIRVQLLADGKVVETKEVTEKDGWKYSFENLDKYKNGTEIVYTIDEEVVKGYTKTVKGYNLINTKPNVPTPTPTPTPKIPENPKKVVVPHTGDDTNLTLSLMVLILSLGIVVYSKKRLDVR